MKILHLNSNFAFTKIYQNQLNYMSHDFKHVIYNPIKKGVNVNVDSQYELYTPQLLSKSDSLLSIRRRQKSLKFLEEHIDLSEVALIHAHTLTNDGLLALALHKKYNIPYVLTIRNTDINFSIKYKVHLRGLFRSVIKHANTIIFPNHVYNQKIKDFFQYDDTLAKKLSHSVIIPNGIDSFWHEHALSERKQRNQADQINLLYVGRIYPNKNLHRVLKAIDSINKEGQYAVRFNVVGQVIDQKYFDQLEKEHDFEYLGVKGKEEIQNIMKTMDVFTMPSENETFGLVYIEAMSQNLPIVYTKHEGIYGYFENGKYGIAADAKDEADIKEAILHILNHYEQYQDNLNQKNFLNAFKWDEIGQYYNRLYKENAR